MPSYHYGCCLDCNEVPKACCNYTVPSSPTCRLVLPQDCNQPNEVVNPFGLACDTIFCPPRFICCNGELGPPTALVSGFGGIAIACNSRSLQNIIDSHSAIVCTAITPCGWGYTSPVFNWVCGDEICGNTTPVGTAQLTAGVTITPQAGGYILGISVTISLNGAFPNGATGSVFKTYPCTGGSVFYPGAGPQDCFSCAPSCPRCACSVLFRPGNLSASL